MRATGFAAMHDQHRLAAGHFGEQEAEPILGFSYADLPNLTTLA